MPPAPIPANEADRLRALRLYRVLDTESEKTFDVLLKLDVGMNVTEAPREEAFCARIRRECQRALEADLQKK